MKYRMLGYERGFTPLDIETVSEMYGASSRRLIVFDYSGTLVEEQSMDQYMKTMKVGGNGAYAMTYNSGTRGLANVDDSTWGGSATQAPNSSQGSGQGSLNGRLQDLPLAVGAT